MRLFTLCIVACFMILLPGQSRAQEDENLLIRDMSANIEAYRKKTVTLRLRLRGVDHIFEKIIFYDRKSSEIEFDISSRETKNRLEKDFLNLHEGMEYRVTFTVQDRGNLGQIMAELLGCRPLVLDKLP